MNKNIEEKKKTQYQKRFSRFGFDPRSVQWQSLGASHQRFRQFWAEIDFNNRSVLDIGCGFGELARFLNKRYKNVDYTGVDIVPEFIAQAQKRFPHNKFQLRDILTDPLDKKFDIVLASGVINTNVKNNLKYREKAIKIMFAHAKRVFAFNMLGSYPQPKTKKGSNVYYADSLEILKYCLTLTRRVLLRHHYHPKDFTIFMYPAKK
jgi:SAM-dependent methyltransferase